MQNEELKFAVFANQVHVDVCILVIMSYLSIDALPVCVYIGNGL